MRVFVQVSPEGLHLSIKNEGRSPATDLKLRIVDCGTDGSQEWALPKARAFTQTIDCLTPEERLDFYLGGIVQPSDIGDPACPKTFTVSATYTFCNTSYTEKTRLDLGLYVSREGGPHSAPPDDPVVGLLREISHIMREQSALIQGLARQSTADAQAIGRALSRRW